MVKVHAAGGSSMMKLPIEGLGKVQEGKERPICIAVYTTKQATSEAMMKKRDCMGNRRKRLLIYAKLRKKVDMNGVVCSTLEVQI